MSGLTTTTFWCHMVFGTLPIGQVTQTAIFGDHQPIRKLTHCCKNLYVVIQCRRWSLSTTAIIITRRTLDRDDFATRHRLLLFESRVRVTLRPPEIYGAPTLMYRVSDSTVFIHTRARARGCPNKPISYSVGSPVREQYIIHD